MTELMTMNDGLNSLGVGLLPHAPPVDAPARLPVSRTAQMMLDMIGLEVVCTMIMEGDRQIDVARRLGVSQSDVGGWLMNHPDRNTYRAAQEISAEALVDKAHELMDDAARDPFISNAQVALVRVRSDALFKQAAMRSKRHRERQDPDDSGRGAIFAPTFVISPVAASEGRPVGITVEQKGPE